METKDKLFSLKKKVIEDTIKKAIPKQKFTPKDAEMAILITALGFTLMDSYDEELIKEGIVNAKDNMAS